MEAYYLDDVETLMEETINQLKGRTAQQWPSIYHRTKTQGMVVQYVGVTKEGKVLFKTSSGTTPGKWWNQEIYFKDLPTGLKLLQQDPSLTHKAMIHLLQTGDMLVYCDDLSFKYWGFQYIAWRGGYGLRKETRYPWKRNPSLKGALCKHLYLVLSVLPFYTNILVRDLRIKGVLDKDWNKIRKRRL